MDAVRSVGTVTLDYRALNIFFRTGLFLNGDTPFREVRRFWPEPEILRPLALSRDQAIDGYIDLFRSAVRQRVVDHAGMGLSGGCDSRHILLELHKLGSLPERAVTVHVPGRDSEVDIAREIARRTGVSQTVVRPDEQRMMTNELYKNCATDFLGLEHGWYATVARSRDASPWWDGIAGDVLSAGLFLESWNLELFRADRLDELANRLVSTHAVPWFREASLFHHDDAVHAVRAELVKHRDAPNPVGSFYFWNRTRGTIAASAFRLLAPRGNFTIAPYLDKTLWQFLAGLPAEMMLDHQLHVDAVRRAFPDFADIPYWEEKVPVSPALLRRNAMQTLQFLMRNGHLSADSFFMMLRVLRTLVDPRRHRDILYLLPETAYCWQITHLSKNGGSAEIFE